MEKDSNLEKKFSRDTIFRVRVVSLKSSRLQAYLNAIWIDFLHFHIWHWLNHENVIDIILPNYQLDFMKPQLCPFELPNTLNAGVALIRPLLFDYSFSLWIWPKFRAGLFFFFFFFFLFQ